ncbi:hypothetical protein LEMLEM_LOCUS8742 [Lemmus lemmus]
MEHYISLQIFISRNTNISIPPHIYSAWPRWNKTFAFYSSHNYLSKQPLNNYISNPHYNSSIHGLRSSCRTAFTSKNLKHLSSNFI